MSLLVNNNIDLWCLILEYLDYDSLLLISSTNKLIYKAVKMVEDRVYDLTQRYKHWKLLEDEYEKSGYAEGVEQGRQENVQHGFNDGFLDAFVKSHEIGYSKGILAALLVCSQYCPDSITNESSKERLLDVNININNDVLKVSSLITNYGSEKQHDEPFNNNNNVNDNNNNEHVDNSDNEHVDNSNNDNLKLNNDLIKGLISEFNDIDETSILKSSSFS